jgi:nucleotide-binding universal stress UspA family protein
MTPSTILCPIDFSSGGEAAVDYAVDLARKLGANLVLLNVIGVPALGVPELGVAVAGTMIEAMLDDHRERLDAIVRERCQGVPAEAMLRTGDVRLVIAQTAQDVGADMIVMGTHGRTGVSRLFMGSVAEAIVRTAPIPVLTVRAH